MLFASGLLNTKMGGPGVFPPLPAGRQHAASTYLDWKTEKDAAEDNRRSVYVFVQAEPALSDVRGVRFPGYARNLLAALCTR